MQRSKALAFAALIAVLVVGGAVGFTVDRLVHGSCSTASRRNVDILADRLSLSTAQRAAVDSILDKRHRDFETALVPVRPKLDSTRGARGNLQAARSDPARAVPADDRRIAEQSGESALTKLFVLVFALPA